MTDNIRTNFCATCREQADRIEALTAENERLREALEWAADHVPWLVDEILSRAALGKETAETFTRSDNV